MVERQKEKFGWEFLFLGANIDASSEAEKFGIRKDRAVDYHADPEGTAVNYKALSQAVSCVRSCERDNIDAALTGWDEEIRVDYQRRKRYVIGWIEIFG